MRSISKLKSAIVLATASGFAFALALFVLVFIASILLNIVDAAYSCIVLDLDNYRRTRTFHRPAMATAVLVKVKPDFVVVEQPSGGYAAYAVGGQPSAPLPVAVPVGANVPVAVPVGQPVPAAGGFARP